MRGRRFGILAIAAAIVVVSICGAAVLRANNDEEKEFAQPRELTVNGMTRAIGVDPDQVSFAWRVGDPRPNARQTAYRIIVATSPK